jgi:hypothetical protein
MSYLLDLFTTKTISESSKQLYMRNLKQLNQNQPITDFDFLKNIDEIKSIISKYKPTTRRSFIIAVISVVKDDPEIYKTYFDLLTQTNQEVKISEFKKLWTLT